MTRKTRVKNKHLRWGIGLVILSWLLHVVQFYRHGLPISVDRRFRSEIERHRWKKNAREVNFTMYDGRNIMFPSNVTRFYSKRRYDRAGAAIQDYLMAHAFSYNFGREYAGACGPNSYPNNYRSQVNMIGVLGLQDELLIVDTCPTKEEDASAMILDNFWMYYLWKDTDIWTADWVAYMQQSRQINRTNEDKSKQQGRTMVVHMRRGDVSPCDNYTSHRYLPNSHYLTLVNQYRTNNISRVLIHSEYLSPVEPWSDFDDIDGIEFKLDADPAETWSDILNAEVYIMSKSSFSLVPGVFSKASKVIYTPFWHRPQPLWITVNQTITGKSLAQIELLRQNNCSALTDSLNNPRES